MPGGDRMAAADGTGTQLRPSHGGHTSKSPESPLRGSSLHQVNSVSRSAETRDCLFKNKKWKLQTHGNDRGHCAGDLGHGRGTPEGCYLTCCRCVTLATTVVTASRTRCVPDTPSDGLRAGPMGLSRAAVGGGHRLGDSRAPALAGVGGCRETGTRSSDNAPSPGCGLWLGKRRP